MILAYVYDFISFLFEKEIKKEIKSVVLFGSVASEEFDEQSDIDIFIEIWDLSKRLEIEKKVKIQLNNFEDKASRTWYPRGIKNPFSIIVGNLDENKWQNLKYDIISNGIFLYGKYEKLPGKMQHNILITFPLNKLKQLDKMKLIRQLYGYEIKKNEKKYAKKGLLQKYNGIKISSNAILVPVDKSKEFRKFLSEFKLTPQIREMWTR